ncbi:uncharacterized protein LOC135817371 isoform X1 [Sycon ciliatum]|uniref:uncharacterized protein LOC135817371 isoform X1 n=1 Tax=Sycon ciliatum TaxID=27933 RepID=UPI0031F6B28F
MRSLQLGSIMAYLPLYLAPLLLLLVMTVNCGQAMATPTPVVQHIVADEQIDNGHSQDNPAAIVTEDTNCMTEWLLKANSSRARAVTILSTPAAIQAMLDEKVVKLQRTFVLSLILGLAPQLATDLKHCIYRTPECPTTDLTRHLPCSLDGECVFNITQQSAVCVCPAGLTGGRCDADIDECSLPTLNTCDQPAVATCFNAHGSFGCECDTGFKGDGRVCNDLDECTAGVHECNEHAMCNNTVGSYSCYCQSGYKGDGTNVICEVDLCGSSANSELCYQIEDMKTYNKRLEEKLEARDIQINQLLSDVKILTTIFVEQKTKIDKIEIEAKRDSRAIQQHSAEQISAINATLQEERQKTKQHFRTIRQHSAEQFSAINTTLEEEGRKTKQQLSAMKQHSAKQFAAINASLKEEGQKCGVVAWKSFRQTTGNSRYRASWNVMYNKTRSDTVLRVTYTSAFGSGRTSDWNSFTISILINNTECLNPGPIRSGVTGYAISGDDRSVTPGSISGICNINTAGPLKLSTKFTQLSSSGYMYDGYSSHGGNRLVATFHVEELCSN